MTSTRWINPQAPEPQAATVAAPAAARVRSTHRLRLGTLDNTKDNASLLLAMIGERARAEFGAELVLRRKAYASVGASVEILDELAREADFVLTAMAD